MTLTRCLSVTFTLSGSPKHISIQKLPLTGMTFTKDLMQVQTGKLRIVYQLPLYTAIKKNSLYSPTFSFVERLSEFYPEAKVILVKRNPDDWYKSVLNTLCKLVSQLPENTGEGERRIVEMLSTIWLDGSLMDLQKFKGNPEIIKAKYQAHNNWVIQNVPADRLLVLDLRDGIGWEKLCAFLDKPVPAQPFPHKNSTEFFNAVRLPYLLKALESHRPAPIISPAK